MQRVRFLGVGSFVPRRAVSNARIAAAIPGWTAERIEEKTGIRERRFLWDFDEKTGRALAPPSDDGTFYPANNTDMAEVALRRALAMAQIEATGIDALFLVTCSPDELNFSHDAMELHRRLGCREDAYAMVFDSGCGGTLYTIDMARRMIEGGSFRTIAVVASNFTSAHLNREVYTAEQQLESGKKANGFLSMYVFGDGAGALILRADGRAGDDTPGIVRSFAGTAHADLVLRKGGGNLRLGFQGRAGAADHAFIVDGQQVARTYPLFMKKCIDGVLGKDRALAPEVKRWYFHQPNKRLMDSFVEREALPRERVACHVERHGNTSAAGMLILLAEDLRDGAVEMGRGDLVLLAAIGANVNYGAQLVRL
jgi:3-oxoacyl-[acyl-carrier-protein] synthase III